MKKIVVLFVLLIVGMFSIQAQKIEMKKIFGGQTFSQNGKTLSVSEVTSLMNENSEAYKLMKSAKSNYTWGMILGGAGGALIGFPVGTAIGGGDAKWELAVVGAGLIVASIPIASGFNKKSKKAVELYNASIISVGYQFQPTFNLDFKENRFGVSMNF
jgi:hypothetical protein